MPIKKKAAIIAGSVVGALVLVILIAIISAPKGITTAGEGYELTGQRIAYRDNAFFIKGSVKNLTGHIEAFTISWDVFDKEEQKIGNASVTVGPVDIDQSMEFEAPITSTNTMFDLMLNGGQQTQTTGPSYFELVKVEFYTETMNENQGMFGGLFGGFPDWFF